MAVFATACVKDCGKGLFVGVARLVEFTFDDDLKQS